MPAPNAICTDKYNKINYRQALTQGVKSPYSKKKGGVNEMLREVDYVAKRMAEAKAVRLHAAVGKYGELGKPLVDYVSRQNPKTRKNFADLIVANLESEQSNLRVTALMALMSAFELIMEDKITFVMDETRQSRFDSMRIT